MRSGGHNGGRPFGWQGAWILIPDFPNRSWAARAACAGHGFAAWFADDSAGRYPDARPVCDRCVVKRECLAWAVDAKIGYGMWGGLNPTERARAARQRRAS